VGAPVVLDGDGHTLRFCSFGVSLGRVRIFLGHWLITAVALAVSARMVPGIYLGSWAVLLVAALVLGLANAVVRPVLVILTFPITIITLGLFYLVVNGAVFALAAALVPGFRVASLGSAVVGALVVSLVSFLLSWLLAPRGSH
jgi:putative membrane protein